ncbi:MAG: hypothetical protein QW417_05075 [Zestosphaera sp.]
MDSLKIEHLVYAPIPYKGYSVRAKSRNASNDVFTSALRDWFIPFDQRIISPGFFERTVVFENENVYLSRVFAADKLDELGRSGVVSHVAQIPVSFIRDNKISLKMIDEAMGKQVDKHRVPLGDLEPLEVPLVEGITRSELAGILPVNAASVITKGVVEERMRVFVLSKSVDKLDLIFALTRVFSEFSVKGLLIASENLKNDVLYLYDGAVIVGKILPPWARTRGWKVVNLERYREVVSVSGSVVEEVLKRIYGGT